jgi:hypothetical protein
MWDPRRRTTLWASTAYYRDSITLYVLPLPLLSSSELSILAVYERKHQMTPSDVALRVQIWSRDLRNTKKTVIHSRAFVQHLTGSDKANFIAYILFIIRISEATSNMFTTTNSNCFPMGVSLACNECDLNTSGCWWQTKACNAVVWRGIAATTPAR